MIAPTFLTVTLATMAFLGFACLAVAAWRAWRWRIMDVDLTVACVAVGLLLLTGAGVLR